MHSHWPFPAKQDDKPSHPPPANPGKPTFRELLDELGEATW